MYKIVKGSQICLDIYQRLKIYGLNYGCLNPKIIISKLENYIKDGQSYDFTDGNMVICDDGIIRITELSDNMN